MHTCCVLVASSAPRFVVSFVKIIIQRSFFPHVPFAKFSTVSHGERPVRNEVYEVQCSALFSALNCYSLYGFLVMKYGLQKYVTITG